MLPSSNSEARNQNPKPQQHMEAGRQGEIEGERALGSKGSLPWRPACACCSPSQPPSLADRKEAAPGSGGGRKIADSAEREAAGGKPIGESCCGLVVRVLLGLCGLLSVGPFRCTGQYDGLARNPSLFTRSTAYFNTVHKNNLTPERRRRNTLILSTLDLNIDRYVTSIFHVLHVTLDLHCFKLWF